MRMELVIAVISLVIAVMALAWDFALAQRVRALTFARGELSQLADAGDFMGLTKVLEARLQAISAGMQELREDDRALAERLGQAVRHLGIVRFDALPGDVGENSFAVSLLDDHASGFVLTSMYGRGAYRLYAKPITDGTAELVLTEEESLACSRALEGTGLVVSSAGRSRRGGIR